MEKVDTVQLKARESPRGKKKNRQATLKDLNDHNFRKLLMRQRLMLKLTKMINYSKLNYDTQLDGKERN